MVKPCSRVATSFTGRPSRRAAKAIQAVRCVRPPREPNAPPMNSETHPHLFGLDAELVCHPCGKTGDELAGLVDDQTLALPEACGGKELERIVMLRRGGVACVDAHGALMPDTLGIPDCRILMLVLDVGECLGQCALAAEARRGRLALVDHAHAMRSLTCPLEAVGEHHGDDLPGMPDARRSPWWWYSPCPCRPAVAAAGLACAADILVSQDIEQIRYGARFLQIEAADLPARDALVTRNA